MIAPNTIQSDEYAQMLFEACRRMEKRLSNLCFDECGEAVPLTIKATKQKH